MNIVVSQPMFFPWVGFLEQMILADVFVVYDDVQFSKGSFTNRVQVKRSYGQQWLTVPLSKFNLGQPIRELRINNQKDWKKQHIRLLESAYRDAKFKNDMLTLYKSIIDYFAL